MGSVAASGGYYIACGADHVMANPGTVTGSIGVIAEWYNYGALLDWAGLKPEVVKRGEFKDIGSPARPVTDRLLVTDSGYFPLAARHARTRQGGAGQHVVLVCTDGAGWCRTPDGRYATNLMEAYAATSCLDLPDEDPAAEAETAARVQEVAPVLADGFIGEAGLCEGWPVPPVRTPAPVSAAGAPPILVVGTTGDPATPYEWAQALAEQLESGRLLTWEGQDHTAYRLGSRCIDTAVDAYFLDGVLPGEGATCGLTS